MATFFGDNLANTFNGTAAADQIFGAGENDTLNGGGGNDTINGDSGNDFLNSGPGQDFLYGGEGNDTLSALEAGLDDLFGGIGDDVYIVNTMGDNLVEGLNQGIDIVRSSVTYILDDNVENLLLTGADIVNGTGNVLGNLITGNSANNNLSGAGGNDTFNGGDGNDTINGDSGNDSLFSGPGQDFMYGGQGNDTLNASGPGLDDLFGGIGDDVYIVSSTINDVVENLNQGIDIVRSSVSYILDANVENLLLTGIFLANGTGNVLDNQITGNSANNNLSGAGGNDTLNGGGGNNTLNGGGGNDILTGGYGGNNRFLFDTALAAAGVDTITDFDIPNGDKIVLDLTVFSDLETVAGSPLAGADFSVINVAAASEVAQAGNSVNEIVYNSLTGSLFYNPNNNVAGFGPGGGRFAKIQGSLAGFSNTAFLVVP